MIAGMPSKLADSSVSANSLRTWAISPRRISVPAGPVTTGMSENPRSSSRRSLVRTRTSPVAVFTPPPGICSEFCVTFCAIASSVSPWIRSCSRGTSIEISRGGAPARSTWVIRGSVRNWSRACSARLRRTPRSCWPYTTTDSTSERLVSRLTIGRSASLGSEVMRSTALLMSASAFSLSESTSSSVVTWPRPSAAVATTRLTPSMPRTASSTARMMPCSTSAGLAPGYGTLIETMSSSVSGNTSCLTREPIRIPPISKNTMIRLAATGFCAIQAIGPVPNDGFCSGSVPLMGHLFRPRRAVETMRPGF